MAKQRAIAMTTQILINGFLSGLIYVLMALGFTLIFGIMRIVSFAHGELYMLGAFATYVLAERLGLNYFAAVALAGLFAGVLGSVIERLFFRPISELHLTGMIMSIAIASSLQAIALIVFGPTDYALTRPVTGVMRFGGIAVPWDRLVVASCSLVILAAFYVFIKWSRTGLAMRAVAEDPEVGGLMGIVPARMQTMAFAIASAMAALAGGLMAPIYTVSPFIGDLPMLKAFVVVVLGGLGSIPGAVLGGLMIGLVESFFSTQFDSTIALIASFSLALLIIIVRPTGLLGKEA
jgi:branched-chain amino acid transport system permease protein